MHSPELVLHILEARRESLQRELRRVNRVMQKTQKRLAELEKQLVIVSKNGRKAA